MNRSRACYRRWRGGYGVVLFNVVFPAWIFYYPPAGAFMVLGAVANLLVDGLVSAATLLLLGVRCGAAAYGSYLLLAWVAGYVVDVTLALLLGGVYALGLRIELIEPWRHPRGLAVLGLAVALGGVAIFEVNRRLAVRYLQLDPTRARWLGLAMGVLTAPWMFLLGRL